MTDLDSMRQTVVRMARNACCIAVYDASARIEDAPLRFSPTSLIRWAYASIFHLLEDDLLALHRSGTQIIGDGIRAGDLIFRTWRMNRHHPGGDPVEIGRLWFSTGPESVVPLGVGHVGLYTGAQRVIHASPFSGWIDEDPIDVFLDQDNGKFRGVRRLLPACA